MIVERKQAQRRAPTCAILGGGMLGQVLALRLSAAGWAVTVLEAAPDVGGLAGAWEVGGTACDVHYHVILPGDDRLLALLDELGLAEEVAWERSQTCLLEGGRDLPLNSGLDYLRLPVLGPVAKLRLAVTLMANARRESGEAIDGVPVRDWLVRWSGQEAYDRLWHPLLQAKLGANAEIASASFIWATIRRLYLARSVGGKSETLGFVRGGYARILEALRSRLDSAGVRVLTGAKVGAVTWQGDGVRVETAREVQSFDRVVSTLPAGVTAAICPGLSPEHAARLGGVVYQGVICATMVLDRMISSNYLSYLANSGLPFTAIVEASALTGPGQFGGRHVVYLPRYVTQDDPFWDLDDATIRVRFLDALARLRPRFNEAAILGFRVSRVRSVMAVPTIGYRTMVPPVETNVPGFYVVNSAQIVDGTLNVDATLEVLDRAMPVLLAGAGVLCEGRSAA